jgi:hypothetical protein
MRFMIMVRANARSEAGVMPEECWVASMAAYHEALSRAGVLLDANGLKPSSEGWRVRYSGGARTIIDGPFAETKELIAGYTLIQVRSREEALEWVRRFPSPFGEAGGGEIEVRQLLELEDFRPSESVERLRELEASRR